MVFFSDPAAIKQIFTGDPDQLRSGQANTVFKPFLGPNSLLLDGARHKRERKLLHAASSSMISGHTAADDRNGCRTTGCEEPSRALASYTVMR